MKQEGFLLISDISGYSGYLNESELEHAHESLTDLLNILIERTQSPLEIFKLEGDAVFAYAPKGSFHQGQTLLEALENTYLAFRKALDLMIINTTCTCNACRNIPKLDLKFFLHYGEYTIQELGQFRELLGNDVNLVHRITKNKISEIQGKEAYAAITQAVVDALDMDSLVSEMQTHVQEFADVGEVMLYVEDMHTVWERRKDETRMVVEPDNAAFVVEREFPLPPALLWDYVTKPEFRNYLHQSDSQHIESPSTLRTDNGTVYVCAHGDNKSFHTVLDWEPFEQYTYRQTFTNMDFESVVTLRLVPTGENTRLQMLAGGVDTPGLKAVFFNKIWPRMMVKKGIEMMGLLLDKVEEDIEAGATKIPSRIILGEGIVDQAVAESLEALAK